MIIDSGSRMRSTPQLADQRVTVVSSEQPGSSMAGPAIRAVNLADQLQSAGLRVRLAVPEEPDVRLPVPVAVFGKPSSDKFRQFAATSDVVITQPQRVDVAPAAISRSSGGRSFGRSQQAAGNQPIMGNGRTAAGGTPWPSLFISSVGLGGTRERRREGGRR